MLNHRSDHLPFFGTFCSLPASNQVTDKRWEGGLMRTAKTTLQIMLAVAVIAITVPAGLYLLGNLYFTTERTIEINWDIDLPKGIREEYNVHTPTSFHGDGERYTVFQGRWGRDVPLPPDRAEERSGRAGHHGYPVLS